MAATKKVIIMLIAATAPMDREVAVGPVKSMYYGITNHNSHSSTHMMASSPSVGDTHMIASGSVLQTLVLVQVMVLGPVSDSPLSHW